MSNSQDLYARLGVKKGATDDQIRRAYRTLARKWHPDVNPGDKQAEERFKGIATAYDVLSDPKKRKLYDEFGEEGLRSGFNSEQARAYKQWNEQRAAPGGFGGGRYGAQDFQHFDFADLSDLFSQGGFSHPRQSQNRSAQRKGRDVHSTVELGFTDALRGVEVQAQVPGSDERVTVRIPAGADDGSRLTVKGGGEPHPAGGPPGDLIIETRVRPHPYFRREGLDLYLTLPVTLDEAYNGASIDVPTPDGNVKLKVPPRSQNGARLRLRDKGVSKKNQRGDLYVELSVVLPDRTDDAFSQAARSASDLYSEPVRKDLQL